MIEKAIPIVQEAEIFVVVGTSLVVYPAAGLINYIQPGIPVFVIDKKIPYLSTNGNLIIIEKPATEGIADLISLLTAN
jgi:NAD-dependent deacetylase